MKSRCALIVALSVLPTIARAETPPITLARAQAEARAHAPARIAANADLAAAKVRASAAGRWITHDPVAVGGYRQAAPGADSDDRSWSVGLEWTLDLSRAWTARGEAARATVAAADDLRTAALLDLDAEVAVAFAELAGAQRRVARLAKLVELRELALRIATRTQQAGSGNQLEVDAAALDLHGAQIEAANARGDLAVARVHLARLLGRPDASELTVADDVDLTAAPALAITEALVERDPRVRAAAAQLAAARRLLEAERRAARPDVTVGLEVSRASNDLPAGAFATMPGLEAHWQGWEIGAQLSVPLPLFDRNRVARAETRADVLLAEAHLARVRAEIRAAYAEVHAQLASAIEAARAANEMPAIIDRELQLLDKALRAGGIELEVWAQQARRLVETARTYDEAILSLRRARAGWARMLHR